jgi:hypothetical protein
VNLGYRSEHPGRIELLDMQGRQVHQQIVPPGYQVFPVETDPIHQGLYLLRWSEPGRPTRVGKVIIHP